MKKTEPIKTKSTPLKNKRHETFARNYALNPKTRFNATKAYQETTDVAYESANSAGARLLVKDSITKRINELYDEIGINDVSLVKKGREFLSCKKAIIFEGQVTGETEDTPSQLEAWKFIHKIKGHLQDNQPTHQTNTINQFYGLIDDKTRERILLKVNTLRQELNRSNDKLDPLELNPINTSNQSSTL